MSLNSSQKFRLFGFYLLLIVFACLPIWSVERFINQDGLPHVYNAFLMLELLQGNASFSQIYSLNSVPLPNLTGYFFLSGLLLFFSAATATKAMVTFTFASFVAAVGWLRFQTVGIQGLHTSLLLGTALGLNWMWFLGFYNFIIGITIFTFTLGLFWRWRENLDFRRSFALSILFICAYFSHLIGFAMLTASVLVVCIFLPRPLCKRNLRWMLAAILPVLPLIIGYKLLTDTASAGFSPTWQHLSNPLSISDWILQWQGADPFLLLSRKAFPFSNTDSKILAVFSPAIWLIVSLFCLSLKLFSKQWNKTICKERFAFILLMVFAVLFWCFSPDDFGKSHGGFLRERILLCGLVCFTPLFQSNIFHTLKKTAQACLIFVIIFQTAAIWEYALWANKLGAEYLAAKQEVEKADSLASIILIKDGCRFRANPMVNMNTLLGINNETRIWDNYEIGYYLFPVVAQRAEEARFVFDFTGSNAINLCNPPEIDEKFSRLNTILSQNHDKIAVLLLWNGNERARLMLTKWFENEPFFQNGSVALYRHRR